MYGLHALSIVVGLVTTLAGTRTYLFGLPSLAAAVMNFLRRGQVRGTWLDSHFDYQLRTLGWAAFWLVMATLGLGSFLLIMTRFPFLLVGYAIIGAWCVYRATLGWRALLARRPAPSRPVEMNS